MNLANISSSTLVSSYVFVMFDIGNYISLMIGDKYIGGDLTNLPQYPCGVQNGELKKNELKYVWCTYK